MPSSQFNLPNRQSDPHIDITLLCHSDNSEYHFSVSPHLPIGELLEQALEGLAQGDNAERMRQLRDNYEPVLELLIDNEVIELKNNQTLAKAGIRTNATCQIAARPLKEKLMFCRYANPA